MNKMIESIKNAIIQIRTPYGSGSGFYLTDYNVIVTNRHVIQGCRNVVINGENFEKQETQVLFTDPVYDIAFLKSPENVKFPDSRLSDVEVKVGEPIIALGHPLGLSYTATQGIVSKSDREFNGVDYIQIDAAINPGNSGGPVLNQKGQIVGVNTFIISQGQSLGFALPNRYLQEELDNYEYNEESLSVKCPSCASIIMSEDLDESYCPNCGGKMSEEDINPKEYEPTGIHKKIEEILEKTGKDVTLSRVGPFHWEVEEGSALIKIFYDKNTRFVIGDAFLCKLPKTKAGEIFQYLLEENYRLEDVVFSISGRDVVLSLHFFDEDLSFDQGVESFGNLFQIADDVDNVLIEKYKAVPTSKFLETMEFVENKD